MPTNRFQFSDDFVLNNGNVGINSATPQEELDVVGGVRGDNLKVSGISSFTTYEGFLNSNHNITENTNLEAGKGITGSLSGEVIVGTGLTVTGISSAVSGQGQVDSLKVYTTLNVPVGLTTDRPIAPKPGQLFYNREFATVEFYTGDAWRQVDNTTQRGRGVFNTGYTTPGNVYPKTYEFINISTQGNAVNFGTLTESVRDKTGCSSSTRGLFGGGLSPSASNVIEYITIASEGNGIDFGDLISANGHNKSCSSSTRGLWGGGYVGPAFVNVINYVQISTLGNALDFGDLSTSPAYLGACASATRGIFGGGTNPGFTGGVNTIDFITISSLGNAVNFGSLSERRARPAASANSIRGIFYTGNPSNANVKSMEYITISSTGNGTVFGDLFTHKTALGATASSTRGVCAGGEASSVGTNVIEFINIQSLGNAQDFGDLANATSFVNACSDSHGGLGGF